MKFYIEKDDENRVITKGTTGDDAVIENPLIEVTEEEFNNIEQYIPPIDTENTVVQVPTQEERITAIETLLLEVFL